MGEGTCSSCRTAITWARTENGKPMPIDREPTVDGNLVLTGRTVRGMVEIHYLRKGELPKEGQSRWTSHFATCPDRDQHRR